MSESLPNLAYPFIPNIIFSLWTQEIESKLQIACGSNNVTVGLKWEKTHVK